jgi:hypothetical protein
VDRTQQEIPENQYIEGFFEQNGKAYSNWLAETARFELAVRVTPYDSLANCWFQPLTHVSTSKQPARYSEAARQDQ